MHDFVLALQNGERHVLTSAADSLVSHLLAFAAEEARLAHRVVDVSAFLEQMGA
jgi:hypothetical protein